MRRRGYAGAFASGAYGLAATLLLVTGGCWHTTRTAPTHLADGTPARRESARFEGVDPPVVASVARTIATPSAGCVHLERERPGIERVDTLGSSVTVVSRDRRWARACDSSAARRNCGQAIGRLGPRGVRDPRLSMTCTDSDGAPLGFVWLEPSARTAYIVVERGNYAEAYAVRGRVPVRVTTRDIDVATSSGRVRFSEHGRDGARLTDATLEAHVSG